MKSLPKSAAEVFLDVAETVTPEVATLDAEGRSRMIGIVDAALMDRDSGTRQQIGTFLKLIRFAPVLRYGRTFDRLGPERRVAVLRWFQDGPVGLFRQGFWGLKAMVFMGYYGRPEARAEVGYAPEFDGRGGLGRA
ncbi:MAG: hypothetical protein V2I67_11190 [Thermoanaerobaculales bacterium]|nr:hypothetical protein [Thermoanaerobaculales bacterium]